MWCFSGALHVGFPAGTNQFLSKSATVSLIRMPNQPVKVPPTKALMDAVIRHAHRSVTTEKNTASGRPKFLEVPEDALG